LEKAWTLVKEWGGEEMEGGERRKREMEIEMEQVDESLG